MNSFETELLKEGISLSPAYQCGFGNYLELNLTKTNKKIKITSYSGYIIRKAVFKIDELENQLKLLSK